MIKELELLRIEKGKSVKEALKMEQTLESSTSVYNQIITDLQSKLQSIPQEYENSIRMKDKDILSLQKKLKVAIQNANPESVSSNMEIQQLHSIIAKKDSEIAFLKETVRVECEERMGLVSSVAKLQLKTVDESPLRSSHPSRPNSSQKYISASNKKASALGKALERSASSNPARAEPKLSAKDAEFFQLFKNAALKNAKKLAKQSRSSLGNY